MPQGTVSIVGPGTEENWGCPAGSFKPVADQYMSTLLACGHPIFNPEHVYNRMTMNVCISTSRKTKVVTERRDIRLFADETNNQALVEATIAVVTMTQFLGNLVDVAAAEGTALADSVVFSGVLWSRGNLRGISIWF